MEGFIIIKDNWQDFYQLKPRSERKSVFKILEAIVGIVAASFIIYTAIVDNPQPIVLPIFLFLIPAFFFISFVEALIDGRKRNAVITGISGFITLIGAIFVAIAPFL
ncbi:hypothetical protein [Oceanobacillus jeddahense]|uniref:hypothetical protein n=1 Tax=Oceanobacillus jeddahense TaxID=1462527 RepID=UPI0005960E1E|nr:hypothetical protein [Oceanobacillus jeddahense]